MTGPLCGRTLRAAPSEGSRGDGGPGVPEEVTGYPLLEAEAVVEPQEDDAGAEEGGDDGGAG
ncbi:hypothetical protein [Streptomyces sp. WAC 06725]|uniref:hypothetical protein n=1 Tax=Streptomyces sp. WAC 06725 TaxID=2203209 RepID=UPI000F7429FA|nr:hypothetical protein [Streptomyces sp. WAC 06725]